MTGFTARAFPVTAGAAICTFMDDDNTTRTAFYSISMGALGEPRVGDGARVWIDNNETLPASAFRDFGPMYTTMAAPLAPWGLEVEPTNTMRFASALFAGDTTWSDWYYPSSGLLIANTPKYMVVYPGDFSRPAPGQPANDHIKALVPILERIKVVDFERYINVHTSAAPRPTRAAIAGLTAMR